MSVRALVLDRDGVLNELWHEPDLGTVDSPARPDQVRLAAGAADAVRAANRAGVRVVVASNQPGVAKGKCTPQLLDAVTGALLHLLAAQGAHVDDVRYCVHHPDAVVDRLRAGCPRRKPGAGLLLDIARDLGIAPGGTWFVGDTHVDVAAGRAGGFRTAWVGRSRCDVCPTRGAEPPDLVAPDLLTATLTILEGENHDAALSRQR
ncbi:hydrolase, HAD-superfamily, subfamily IIIA [Cellulomonas flavigena DSM 20109]|uniref:D,D-heptose 1,7-bisphosphate phosphatase n=1 Tax=Cellulomonas flavigena (strain ATCC 482 / DSM 20109 / BCRC 11376 / JCM 18109 / NBRC 3775 / NCIMB 8073 / NRS 134) TaxID=446466 RepID=D5UDL7_CELFN|nr:HAD-IIIA family hydrolase [Cellulomonas flavigena]ADG76473.1 hydrolase, HAD-superfamily, subfamily IIIA [Cellulomonas flavigena DSM 20109]